MDNRKKILVAAGDLFMKYGVRSISMDDIARNLSMSKKTLYQYFQDKDELVLLATRGHMEMEMAEYNEVENNSINAIDELVGVNKCMRKDFKNINPSLLFDLQKYHPAAWQEWLDFKNVYIRNHVARNLKRGIQEGFFREELDPESIATLRVEMVQMAFDESVFSRERLSLKELQMMFFDLFVQGILTEKGKNLYKEYLEQTDFSEL
ncbi:MAG: TetR/AcrR family transcriptional regulator [Candidatus Cyclobacteriaceae bacterium M2_1C_046]